MPTTLVVLLFSALCMIYLIAIFIKRIVKNEAADSLQMPGNSQDDCYIRTTFAIDACKNLYQLNRCWLMIKDFQNDFGNTASGMYDQTMLINQHEEKRIILAGSFSGTVFPDFVESFN